MQMAICFLRRVKVADAIVFEASARIITTWLRIFPLALDWLTIAHQLLPHNVLYDTSRTKGVKGALTELSEIVKTELSTRSRRVSPTIQRPPSLSYPNFGTPKLLTSPAFISPPHSSKTRLQPTP